MKDALGHGSDAGMEHQASIAVQHGVPTSHIVSDATYRATMPQSNYTSQIADLLGAWGGGGLTASKLAPSESAKINSEYGKRTDWRQVAQQINADRQGVAAAVTAKYGRRAA